MQNVLLAGEQDMHDIAKAVSKVIHAVKSRCISMRIAKVGILIDQKAAERRWEFGANVFELFLGEILAHRGISFSGFRI